MTATVSSMSRWMVNCCLGWVLAWVQYSTVQYSTVHYTLQYSTVQYSTVRYSTVQYLALVHPGVPHPQHPHPQLPDAGQGVEVDLNSEHMNDNNNNNSFFPPPSPSIWGRWWTWWSCGSGCECRQGTSAPRRSAQVMAFSLSWEQVCSFWCLLLHFHSLGTSM